MKETEAEKVTDRKGDRDREIWAKRVGEESKKSPRNAADFRRKSSFTGVEMKFGRICF